MLQSGFRRCSYRYHELELCLIFARKGGGLYRFGTRCLLATGHDLVAYQWREELTSFPCSVSSHRLTCEVTASLLF